MTNSVALPPDLWSWIEGQAKAAGVSRSQVVFAALSYHAIELERLSQVPAPLSASLFVKPPPSDRNGAPE